MGEHSLDLVEKKLIEMGFHRAGATHPYRTSAEFKGALATDCYEGEMGTEYQYLSVLLDEGCLVTVGRLRDGEESSPYSYVEAYTIEEFLRNPGVILLEGSSLGWGFSNLADAVDFAAVFCSGFARGRYAQIRQATEHPKDVLVTKELGG